MVACLGGAHAWNQLCGCSLKAVPVSEQLSPAGEAGWLFPLRESIEPEEPGLVTVESDLQQADNVTGVVTAFGNVRITYPGEASSSLGRQAQYFTKEERIVLIGDVDVVQEGGNRLNAERVTYLVLEDRLIADPAPGDQVFSKFKIQRTAPSGGCPVSLQAGDCVHLSFGWPSVCSRCHWSSTR